MARALADAKTYIDNMGTLNGGQKNAAKNRVETFFHAALLEHSAHLEEHLNALIAEYPVPDIIGEKSTDLLVVTGRIATENENTVINREEGFNP